MKKHKLLFGILLTIVTCATIWSCNKGFDRVITVKDGGDTATVRYGNRKVLYLIVDGARGQSVLEANTPNINALLPNSIYSWVSLSDPDSLADVSNYANMLTGAKKEKHNVLKNDLSNNNLLNFPIIFKRIKQELPQARIVSHTSSPLFKSLTDGADVSDVLADDGAVRASVINTLNSDTASVIVGHFTNVKKVGKQVGFDNSFPQYKAAIENFDTSVGDILAALRKRPTFATEDWLVVIASSGGGAYTSTVQSDQTVFSNTSANTFVVYYNPSYKQRIITKPFTGNRYLGKTVRMDKQVVRAEIDTANAFNLDDTTTFTIELKVKKNGQRQSYPAVLGKRNEWSSGHPSVGWVFYLQDDYWFFEWRGAKDGDYHQAQGAVINEGRWETLTAKKERRGTQYFLRVYTNGSFNSEVEITNSGSLSNDNKLKMGYINGQGHGEPDVYVSDIRFFKTAVPDAVIARYSCETSINQSHPYYNFIVGYWPCTDGVGDKFEDLGPSARNFKLVGPYVWENFNDLICPPDASILARFVIQTSDIPIQITNWLKIANKQSWNLDGRVWLDQ
ncbi:DUF4983 domain-containing protein [Pedobacter sp. UYP30]|uniref:DUF4983 domain-containing protein n=1 Tax=Pedobacter sp. UYP30 TaxID=1756400 RepID=UPI00339ABE66